MFYMCGSDLESRYGYASGNLVEIANTHDLATLFRSQAERLGLGSESLSREVNAVLQTGGCREWHNMEKTARTTDTQIRTDVLQRWRYDPYEDVSTAEIRLQQELPLASMSDPQTLSDFFRWSVQEYPAEKCDEFCCVGLIEQVYGESLYEIPVQIDSDIWCFRCGYSPEKGYEIYGVWEGYNSSSNMFNRNVVSLSSMAGQNYRLLYPILDTATELQGGEYEYSEPQAVARVLPVDVRLLPPGTYYIQYVVEDMFMRRIPMERVEVTWDGEKLTLAENAVWEGTATLRWEILSN